MATNKAEKGTEQGTMSGSVLEVADNDKTFVLSSYEMALPVENVQTFIIDPPYNIGFNYRSGYKDSLEKQEYSDGLYEVLEMMFESSNTNASCFLINYPEIIAEYYHTILDTSWNVYQWINWVYPSNIGHSKKRFTKASRTVLWLAKDDPKIHIDAIQQPYKNPTDKRIKELVANGKTGTNLYDWWEINLCKNVSKDKSNYVNQIPEELLKRLILTTTDEGDLVADPMCGSGSTVVTAAKLDRVGWGCDLNENLIPVWEKHCGFAVDKLDNEKENDMSVAICDAKLNEMLSKATEPLSHIIFPNHRVVSVEANDVDKVAELAREALKEHDNDFRRDADYMREFCDEEIGGEG